MDRRAESLCMGRKDSGNEGGSAVPKEGLIEAQISWIIANLFWILASHSSITANRFWILTNVSRTLRSQFSIIPSRSGILTTRFWIIPDRFSILADVFWIIAVQFRIIALIQKCTAMQFWIIPMIQNAPRCILNHLDTIRRTLGNVQSVQILVTDRIGSVQNRFGSSFSTFEVRPETLLRVRGRFSSIQNCIAMIRDCTAMIRWITGVRQNVSGCARMYRGASECIGVHFESSG